LLAVPEQRVLLASSCRKRLPLHHRLDHDLLAPIGARVCATPNYR